MRGKSSVRCRKLEPDRIDLRRTATRWTAHHSEAASMTPNPNFDFQIGKNTRLRGWGLTGLAALVLVLAYATFAADVGYDRLSPGISAIVTRLNSARGKAW